MTIRAVLFDAVDTLIRPWPSVGSVYARAAAAHGVRCRARDLEACFRPAYRELFPKRFFGSSHLQTSESRERAWWRRVVALSFARAGHAHPPEAVLDAAFEAFSRGAAWRTTPGAVEMLRALAAQGVKIALVSNYDARLRRVLKELRMEKFFSTIAISSEVGWAKPSPRIYRSALEALGVAPADALMVGDRMVEDYRGACAAGLNALLFAPRGRGLRVIRDLRRLPGRLAEGRIRAERSAATPPSACPGSPAPRRPRGGPRRSRG